MQLLRKLTRGGEVMANMVNAISVLYNNSKTAVMINGNISKDLTYSM